jgi:hypothetical protein
MYFATAKSFASHRVAIHPPKDKTINRVTEFMNGMTPRMIIESRANEVLVESESFDGNMKEVEWWNAEDVQDEIRQLPLPADISSSHSEETGFPIIDMENDLGTWLLTTESEES